MRPELPSLYRVCRRRLALAEGVALLTGVLSLFFGDAAAGVHACTLPGGGKQFQDRPCKVEPPPAPERSAGMLVKADTRRAGRARPIPANIDVSWLDRPERAVYRAFCDQRGCECGPHERVFSDITLAVADALFIDGAWLRYDETVAALDDAASLVDSFTARSAFDDATCDLLMSQRTLRLFVEPTLQRLERATNATTRSNAQLAQDCGSGDERTCDALEARMMHQRMNLDLDTLRRPRTGLPSDR